MAPDGTYRYWHVSMSVPADLRLVPEAVLGAAFNGTGQLHGKTPHACMVNLLPIVSATMASACQSWRSVNERTLGGRAMVNTVTATHTHLGLPRLMTLPMALNVPLVKWHMRHMMLADSCYNVYTRECRGVTVTMGVFEP